MKAPLGKALAVGLVFLASNTPASDLLLAGFSADAVVRFDGTTGALIGTFASHPSMDGPTALVYNSAGNLLVLNEFSHNVLKFDGTSGAFISEMISSATLGGAGLTDPADMELGADGNLYIMSHFNTGANIWRFDSLTGAYLGAFTPSYAVHHTHGLTFGPGGNLFQGNVDAGNVERFSGASGTSLGTFTSGSVFAIADLTFGPTKLYVTLDGGGGVAQFDAATGTYLGPLIPGGAGQSYWGILVNGGFLYVANKDTGTVKKYDAATGAFISDFITGGPGAFDIVAMPVPEPGCGSLALAGVAALIAARRLRRN